MSISRHGRVLVSLAVGLLLLAGGAATAPVAARERSVAPSAPRFSPLRAQRTSSALGACRVALREVRAHAAAGRRPCVVFDIDNTLVDTRARTQAAAHSFGRQARRGAPQAASVRALRRLALGAVGYDARATAAQLDLPSSATAAFQRHWLRFFWKPSNLRHDRPIRATIALARRAKAAGAEVFYLTGRTRALSAATILQLASLGLPDADVAHVLTKPEVAVPTGRFKRDAMQHLLAQKRPIGWFMTDSASDIAAVKSLPDVRPILIGFPVNPAHAPPVAPQTPVLRLH